MDGYALHLYRHQACCGIVHLHQHLYVIGCGYTCTCMVIRHTYAKYVSVLKLMSSFSLECILLILNWWGERKLLQLTPL